MKHTTKRICAALLTTIMLAGTVACTGTGTPTETDGKETVGTEGKTTAGVTDVIETEGFETEPLEIGFTVTEKDGVASVSTTTDISYDVTGYKNIDVETGVFKFKGDMLISFTTDVAKEQYNRFTMTYSSDKALRVYIRYHGTKDNDMFYVEAGTGDFSALIESFWDGRGQRNLEAIRIEPCVPGWVNFSLSGFRTEKIDVPEQTYFLENERFKLGIALCWGGAISYLEDKTCTVEGLTNLVNRHDTGRLIQQSYYGTRGENNSYEPGNSYGQIWPYNPVQGGSENQVGSRLIDFSVTGNTVYIKAQPAEWAKQGELTAFYVENYYTVEDDFVRVDNRAVDFLGVEHPYHFQELPAVYAVGYLNTLTCYNGDKPWTNGSLNVYRDLPFWSHGRQIVYFAEQNTETWFAWYNEDSNFGLGCYVPAIDSIGGGRNEPYLPEKRDNADSISYAGGANIMLLKSFEPLEYSYLLTTGTPEEIRETFAEHKDFAENGDLSEDCQSWTTPIPLDELESMDLSKEQYSAILSYTNCIGEIDATEGALKLTSKSGGAAMNIQYYLAGGSLLTKDHYTIKIEYMMPTTNTKSRYNVELYPFTGSHFSFENAMKKTVSGFIADGQYHTMTIDMSDHAYWDGSIEQLQFRPFNSNYSDEVIYIKSITLTNEESDRTGLIGVSLDTFKVNGENFFDGDGDAESKLDAVDATITFEADTLRESMTLCGWIGFDQAIDSFGYFINHPDNTVYGSFKQETGSDVLAAGGEHASRFEITVPLAELSMGYHSIGFVVKLADGMVITLYQELTVIVVPKNIALNKPTTATSVQGGVPYDVGPAMATDGDMTTRWSGAPTGTCDLIVDLETIHALMEIKVVFEQAMMDYTVSVSEDGVNYTVIGAGDRYEFVYDPIVVTFPLDGMNARYVKVSRIDDGGSHYFSIWDMYVYGEQAE